MKGVVGQTAARVADHAKKPSDRKLFGRGSKLRALALRRNGASPRIAVALSLQPGADRGAFATVNVPKGGFITLYRGRWKYVEETENIYRGSNPNVVESNGWRVVPQLDRKLGKVSDALHLGAMLNEAPENVRPPRAPVIAALLLL